MCTKKFKIITSIKEVCISLYSLTQKNKLMHNPVLCGFPEDRKQMGKEPFLQSVLLFFKFLEREFHSTDIVEPRLFFKHFQSSCPFLGKFNTVSRYTF